MARAIQGSNSIEGYQVDEDDVAAALDGADPISADDKTFLEIQGYRQAAHLWLTFNLRAHHMQAQTVARRVAEAGETEQTAAARVLCLTRLACRAKSRFVSLRRMSFTGWCCGTST